MIGKRIILSLIVAALVAIPLTASGAGPSGDGNSPKVDNVGVNAKMKVLTGSWVFTLTAPGMPPFKSLFTFSDDGGLVTTGAFIVPFGPPIGVGVFSAGHGEWEKIRSGEFAFTFVALIHDQTAQLVATSKITGSLEVNEAMNAISGNAHACDYDLDGNVIFCFDGVIQGERIRVEP